jgi:hypothetical protein
MADEPDKWDEARFEAHMKEYVRQEVESRLFAVEDRLSDAVRYAVQTRAQLLTQLLYGQANSWLQAQQMTFQFAEAQKKYEASVLALRGAIDSLRTALELEAEPVSAFEDWQKGLTSELSQVGIPQLANMLSGENKMLARLRPDHSDDFSLLGYRVAYSDHKM